MSETQIEFSPLIERVKDIKPSDVRWSYENSCSVAVPLPLGKTECVHNLDPCPCYSHNLDLVRETAAHCEKRFPTQFPTIYAVLPVETMSRTNGWATKEYVYGEKRPMPFIGVILLSGKRIPLHPAMTRYLVAHEYGHIADFHLCYARGLENDGLDAEYAQMRGIPHRTAYGPQNWHTEIGEVIANDFRISVCGVEREFWPHPYDHPDNVPAVAHWWSDMMLKFVGPPRKEKALPIPHCFNGKDAAK